MCGNSSSFNGLLVQSESFYKIIIGEATAYSTGKKSKAQPMALQSLE